MKKTRLFVLVLLITVFTTTLLNINDVVVLADDNKTTQIIYNVKADIKFINKLAKNQFVKQYDVGDLIVEPKLQEIPGYDMVGWFTEDGKQWNFDSDRVQTHTTLYAKYKIRIIPFTGVYGIEINVLRLLLIILLVILVVLIIVDKKIKKL